MAGITEGGLAANTVLTETGEIVFGSLLTESGDFVFGLAALQVFADTPSLTIRIIPSVLDGRACFETAQVGPLVILPGASERWRLFESPSATIQILIQAIGAATFVDKPRATGVILAASFDTAIFGDRQQVGPIILLPSISEDIPPRFPHAFVFAEAQILMTLPSGVQRAIEFSQGYTLERLSTLVEDGSASFFDDRLTLDTINVDDLEDILTAETLDTARIIWLNEDDGRLVSAALTDVRLVGVVRKPIGGVEGRSLVFASRSLPKH